MLKTTVFRALAVLVMSAVFAFLPAHAETAFNIELNTQTQTDETLTNVIAHSDMNGYEIQLNGGGEAAKYPVFAPAMPAKGDVVTLIQVSFTSYPMPLYSDFIGQSISHVDRPTA